MDLEAGRDRTHVRLVAQAQVILLDTHAVIWLSQGHRRAKPLERFARLYISPATILEIQFLTEIGKLRFAKGMTIASVADDLRWRLDEPPSVKWFTAAGDLNWTRDPFDRLLAAHAAIRGWKLATADDVLLEHLPEAGLLPL